MSNEESIHELGFIVEGDGEYHSFKSIVSKIINRHIPHIPIINAAGIGGILKKEKLHQNLSDLTRLNNLRTIIVCVDLIDALEANFCTSCENLKSIVDQNINEWIVLAVDDKRVKNIPKIVFVIQIQKFETWLISNTDALVDNEIFKSINQEADVDAIKNPSKFIKENSKSKFDSKNPMFVRKIVSILNPSVMRTNSKSFDKLAREVELALS